MVQPAFRGDRLLAAREAAGLSRDELTLRLGFSSPLRIKVWEDGAERPRPSLVPPLAAAVGVDPLHLLDVDPADPPLAALRIAAGLALTQMARPRLSVMRYQRIEGGQLRDVSGDVVTMIAQVMQIDPRRVEASIQRTRRDVGRAHVDSE